MILPKAIIFDLDGTLIHSAPDIHAAANEALKGVGRAPLDLPTIISFIGNGMEALVARCLDATGGGNARLQQTTYDLLLASYTANMTILTRPYPGVVPSLEGFRASGIPLGICTNKLDQPARDICDALDLSRHFEVIAGAIHDRPKKPDPHSLLLCCEQLGVRPGQALYVGDSAIDYYTARNARVPFRLFSEGYLNDLLPDLADADRFSSWATHGIIVS